MKKNIKILIAGTVLTAASIIIAAAVVGDSARVIIDPGHGGNDFGAVSGGRREKDDNLNLALLTVENLKNMGIDARPTRKTDKFVSLEKRCKFANGKKAEVFVSLHRNYAENAKGVEIWISDDKPEADALLARNILRALEKVGISKNRGVRTGYASDADKNYYVNRKTDMPSCLVELGFINSDEDNGLFDANLEAYARAIATAIIETIG